MFVVRIRTRDATLVADSFLGSFVRTVMAVRPLFVATPGDRIGRRRRLTARAGPQSDRRRAHGRSAPPLGVASAPPWPPRPPCEVLFRFRAVAAPPWLRGPACRSDWRRARAPFRGSPP